MENNHKIHEVIISSINSKNEVHLAPMGVYWLNDEWIILPFKPSMTLNNILESKVAVINFCDDVRVFAGCLTGHQTWQYQPAQTICGQVLAHTLAHSELILSRVEEHDLRPKLFCKRVYHINHQPFTGFNRAQYSVLEAAILCSRLKWLPLKKIEQEIDYLRIGLEKTAGEREWVAWGWLMEFIAHYKVNHK